MRFSWLFIYFTGNFSIFVLCFGIAEGFADLRKKLQRFLFTNFRICMPRFVYWKAFEIWSSASQKLGLFKKEVYWAFAFNFLLTKLTNISLLLLLKSCWLFKVWDTAQIFKGLYSTDLYTVLDWCMIIECFESESLWLLIFRGFYSCIRSWQNPH